MDCNQKVQLTPQVFLQSLRKMGLLNLAQPAQYFLFYAYFGSSHKNLDDSRIFRLLARFLIVLIF